MAVWDAGTTNVASAGTSAQVNSSDRRVIWILFKANENNSGAYVYIGDTSGNLSSDGVSLAKGDSLVLNFGDDYALALSSFYVDVTTDNDDVDWTALYVQ